MKKAAFTHYISTTMKGYGHWKITSEFSGKMYSAITADSVAIDQYESREYDEKEGKEGYYKLRNVIRRANNL